MNSPLMESFIDLTTDLYTSVKSLQYSNQILVAKQKFHITCLAPIIRETIKYENQIIRGSIEREAEKTQSIIHELLFYLTEANSQPSQTSKVELLGKIVNSLMPLSLFEQCW